MNKYSNSCVHGKSKDVNKSWCDRAYAWSARVFGANGLCRVSARRVSQHFALVPVASSGICLCNNVTFSSSAVDGFL